MPLTWSIVIATYKREHVLPRALLLAAQSTRAPRQIVVVDASPSWQQTREKVMREIAVKFPTIEWIYEKANVVSSAHQRNQGVELSSSDLVFFIDDDSLMYPNCADEILKVFEKDARGKVVAVGAALATKPPDEGKSEKPGTPAHMQGNMPTQSRLKQSLRRLVEGDTHWMLPYDGDWPAHPIPSELTDLPIISAKTLSGCRMCVRRTIAINEPFESILHRYAYLEDADMSYRASRYGLVLTCLSANICHLEIFGGRLLPYVTAFLSALNPAVLHGIYSTDKTRSKQQLRRQMRRRTLFLALKDMQAWRLTLPSARGVRAAMQNLSVAMSKSESELREWYPQLQESLFERHRGEGD
jgi:GT2 family glycosyltransferase